MTDFIAACVQMRSGQSADENLAVAKTLIRDAASAGALFVQTPEMTNLLVRGRERLMTQIVFEDHDIFIAAFRQLARECEIWIHAGSLAIKRPDGRAANRGMLFAPDGSIAARYDKIHMFDVDLPNGESWRESATYEPGSTATVVELPMARFGLAICYDVRFPGLFRDQARMGAGVLTAPAAFTKQTGEAHWHVLQRARAIENGAYMISAAQTGRHDDGRETYGHSLIVDPWGRVVAELADDRPGFVAATIRPQDVVKARASIPVLSNERDFGRTAISYRLDVETAG
ncbi:MAG: carbon-nitrogen hydrolase family protein [Roseibium sp.]|nr:carbon-nitrogen hydrolase family protein [Roseibium sp.]